MNTKGLFNRIRLAMEADHQAALGLLAQIENQFNREQAAAEA